jgi:hypothetical protein
MGDWWDKYPDAEKSQAATNWWDKYPDAPAATVQPKLPVGPPMGLIGSLPGSPESFRNAPHQGQDYGFAPGETVEEMAEPDASLRMGPPMPPNIAEKLAGRAAKQYANQLILADIERNRPSSAVVTAPMTIGGAAEAAFGDLPEGTSQWSMAALKRVPKLWWELTKTAFSSTDKAKKAQAIEALKELRPSAEFDVPPAESAGEKAVDIGAGIGASVSRFLIARKLVPPGTVLSDAVAWEMVNAAEGGIPGKGAVTAGALGKIGQIPTATVAGKGGKIAAQAGVFGGLTAAEGGSVEDVAVAMLVPVILAPIHYTQKKAKISQVRKGLNKQAMDAFKAKDAQIEAEISRARRSGAGQEVLKQLYAAKKINTEFTNQQLAKIDQVVSMLEAEMNNAREYGGSNVSAAQLIGKLQAQGYNFSQSGPTADMLRQVKGDPRFMTGQGQRPKAGDVLAGEPTTRAGDVVAAVKAGVKAAAHPIENIKAGMRAAALGERPSAASVLSGQKTSTPTPPVQPRTAPRPVQSPPAAQASPQAARDIPKKVQRIEEKGVVTSLDKPQGLYTTPSDFQSPHAELGGSKIEYNVNPQAKILVVDGNKSAGIEALKAFDTGLEVLESNGRAKTNLKKSELVSFLTKLSHP